MIISSLREAPVPARSTQRNLTVGLSISEKELQKCSYEESIYGENAKA